MSRGAVAALGLLLVACVLAPGAPARVPSTCSLLTKAEVTKVLGAKIELTKPSGGTCTWQGYPLSNFTSASPQITLSVAKVSKAKFRKIAHETFIAGPTPGSMQPAPLTVVPGVGQLAYSVEEAGESLYAWSHGYYVEVDAAEIATPLDAEKNLARAAFARLV